MEQAQNVESTSQDDNVTVSVNHCVNTNRTYIYELKNGEIINEKTIHGV